MSAIIANEVSATMIADCPTCGREYNMYPSYVKRRPADGYCSRACRGVGIRLIQPCHYCGKAAATGRRFPEYRKRGIIYCSLACRDADWANRCFWPKVDKTGGCWIWTGAISPGGYGIIPACRQGSRLAHRVAYEFVHGPILDNLPVDPPLPQHALRKPGPS